MAILVDRFLVRRDHVTPQRQPGSIIHPMDSGIHNGYPMYVDPHNNQLPAWYLYPTQQEVSSMIPATEPLKGVNPVIMLLRDRGVVNQKNLINLYRILSSFGYHVVIPID